MQFVANGNSWASRPVLFISVSFHKDEKISPQQRDKVLNDIIKEVGATKENNQYQIVKHNDVGHEHCHMVLNKGGFDGKNLAELKTRLESKGIESTFTQNKNGLSDVSFRYKNQAVKDSEIGFKASEVKKSIEHNLGEKLDPYKKEKVKSNLTLKE